MHGLGHDFDTNNPGLAGGSVGPDINLDGLDQATGLTMAGGGVVIATLVVIVELLLFAKAAVARAVELAKALGAKRAVMLPVSAPFHCALMAPAAEAMAEALAEVSISAPRVPLVANVSVEAVTDPDTIRALLVEQVTGAVRWRESVEYMIGNGVSEFWEIGAGKALSGMVRRIDRSASVAAIGPMIIKGMVEDGYPKPYAAGLVCTGAALSIVIPPSIGLVIVGHIQSG